MKGRAYEIAQTLKYDGYQRGLVSMGLKFFDKKIELGTKVNINEVLAQELNKSMVKKLKRRKGYARFKDNIWAPDLAEMGLLSSKNCGAKYLLCVCDRRFCQLCLG